MAALTTTSPEPEPACIYVYMDICVYVCICIYDDHLGRARLARRRSLQWTPPLHAPLHAHGVRTACALHANCMRTACTLPVPWRCVWYVCTYIYT